MQDHKSKLTQAIDKIITRKIEEADHNIKPDQTINKFLIQKIGNGFKTYIEKLEQDYNSESEDELKDLENELKDIISIRKPAIKNLVTTNDM